MWTHILTLASLEILVLYSVPKSESLQQGIIGNSQLKMDFKSFRRKWDTVKLLILQSTQSELQSEYEDNGSASN